ncbi:hypothetical protein LN996_11480 [Arthrobacter sp. AK01]|uniref:hypothetical protein n=1 Tax=Micrococcaceae TaxID=1268 RepID=UPI001E4FD5E6|nr:MULTISPECIES: hypothetical protein [Micrococcaceae]MCD4851433.1 hypothetical protein [Arthrobacter sp. AK01]MCP1412327.1 hypothetical protein [Paenarthrobacter sp. A20]
MEPFTTLALGVDLHLATTADGGRRTPLLGGYAAENRFKYRPNWGLPGWPDGEQTAAPVLGFSRKDIQPGETVGAVLVPLFPDRVPAWRDVQPGDELRMYEGSQICARGIIVWVEPTTWFTTDDDRDRFTEWLRDRISRSH